ncbi:regulatory protein RecX [Legionella sp. km772]|uniref:regulatory protein RecX n=1 Tax=Legionella sp. km772 TaxID=2498111 RepID=UPI000F8DD152|nr:regulatory protein RecX [Legionella sp. km772]RUR04923.1 regulatory protein RecX [Legionella sp. km772]
MSSMLSVAIKLMAERSTSENDLKQRLEKEFADEPHLDVLINETIMRLRELHLINDSRLAESLAQRYSHKGNRFIQQILRQKGFSEEIITSVLKEVEDEGSRALAEAKKKLGRATKKSADETKRGLVCFLSGRGFSFETINSVIEELHEE